MLDSKTRRRADGLNQCLGHLFSVTKLKQGQGLSQLDAIPCLNGDQYPNLRRLPRAKLQERTQIPPSLHPCCPHDVHAFIIDITKKMISTKTEAPSCFDIWDSFLLKVRFGSSTDRSEILQKREVQPALQHRCPTARFWMEKAAHPTALQHQGAFFQIYLVNGNLIDAFWRKLNSSLPGQ